MSAYTSLALGLVAVAAGYLFLLAVVLGAFS